MSLLTTDSNQPGSRSRDTLSLGHSHLQVSGSVKAQEMYAAKSGSDFMSARADGTCSSNAVTVVGRHGVITTETLTTAAAAEQDITVTNILVTTSSVILVMAQTAGTGPPVASLAAVAAGSFVVTLTNVHASAALNAAVTLHYMIVPQQDLDS
jgi:hypothetical protein